jgi:uncharacterized membrane protein YeaQ/YmgE (transglycosylase-associated protein family)
MLLYIIGLIIVGLIVGALGRLFHPGRDPMSIWMTIGIGVVATLVAGLIFRGVLGFILGVLLAVVLVALYARFAATSARRV